jgi:microcystin-dependent protein
MTTFQNLNDLATEFNTLKGDTVRNLQHTMFYTQSLIGDYKYSSRSSDALGWLICDGRSLSIEEYPALFSVIEDAFGEASSGMFKLPNFIGRVPGAIGATGGLTTRALGAVVGAETHTLDITQIPSHNHTGFTGYAGVGTDIQYINAASGGGTSATDETGNHRHTIPFEGGGLAHNNMQPTLFGGKIFIFAGLTVEN